MKCGTDTPNAQIMYPNDFGDNWTSPVATSNISKFQFVQYFEFMNTCKTNNFPSASAVLHV